MLKENIMDPLKVFVIFNVHQIMEYLFPHLRFFLDPKSSRIRPNSNVISTNLPLKFSDSHSSMQSQVKKKLFLQANDEIPSDSNLFAILNTLNKDGTTNVDSGDISTSKRSANQNIPSMHKSSSSDQLTRSKFFR